MEEIRSNDDGNMLLNLRDAVKRYHYMLSHTNLINGLSMNATVESIMPWWQIALYAIDVVFALLMVGSLFMTYYTKRLREAIEGQEKARKLVEMDDFVIDR